jgi:hypothetical protein
MKSLLYTPLGNNVPKLPQFFVFSCYADLGQKIEVVSRHSLLTNLAVKLGTVVKWCSQK